MIRQATIPFLPLLKHMNIFLNSLQSRKYIAHLNSVPPHQTPPEKFQSLRNPVFSITMNRDPLHLPHNLPSSGIGQPKIFKSKWRVSGDRFINSEEDRAMIRGNPCQVPHKVHRMSLDPTGHCKNFINSLLDLGSSSSVITLGKA